MNPQSHNPQRKASSTTRKGRIALSFWATTGVCIVFLGLLCIAPFWRERIWQSIPVAVDLLLKNSFWLALVAVLEILAIAAAEEWSGKQSFKIRIKDTLKGIWKPAIYAPITTGFVLFIGYVLIVAPAVANASLSEKLNASSNEVTRLKNAKEDPKPFALTLKSENEDKELRKEFREATNTINNLQQQLGEATNRLASVMSLTASRLLNEQEQAKVIALLTTIPNKANILLTLSPELMNGEAREYGFQLETLLTNAGFRVNMITLNHSEGVLTWGWHGQQLLVSGRTNFPPQAPEIQKAFQSVGRMFPIGFDSSLAPSNVIVAIGPKEMPGLEMKYSKKPMPTNAASGSRHKQVE